MHIAVSKKECCGCHACAAGCPRQCIAMERDEEGFWYPKVDPTRCVGCGLCETLCPVLNPVQPEESAVCSAFAVVNPDAGIRRESSSGGVFTALAQQVLERRGVVFGAAWSEDFLQVHHIEVEKEADLGRLRGSKYVQSTLGDTHVRVKQLLREGRTVLFSGTPCQVESLHTFLGKRWENLLLVDIVCHGVAAPVVWQRYLKERIREAGGDLASVSLRDKEQSWKQYSLRLRFENGREQVTDFREDPFMKAFLSDICLRPSCYNCRFKKLHRVSDLTLADFWGIEDVCPEMDDDRGTSLVLVHTQKGDQALKEQKLRILPVSAEAALQENPSAVCCAPEHPDREAFLAALETGAFDAVVRKWARKPVTLKNRIGSLLERLGLIGPVKKLLGRE